MYEVYMLNRPVLFIDKWTGSDSSIVMNEPDDKGLKGLVPMLRMHPHIEQIELISTTLRDVALY